MDGSNAAFLLDTAFLSHEAATPRNGILYIEDFDSLPRDVTGSAVLQPAVEPQPLAPIITQEDLRTARAAGYEEGLAAALADENLLQSELRTGALQSLTEEMARASSDLKALASEHAEDASRAILAILNAALPATMRAHAGVEIQGVIAALLPGLHCEPELRVRAHPAQADLVRSSLIAQLPEDGCILAVCADPSLAEPDVRIAWQDGHAVRDTGAIWTAIGAALAPLKLPLLKDIDHGR